MLQKIFDNIPVMITYFDETGKIKMINHEAVKILGWTFEEWKNENILAKCYPEPEALKEALDFMISKSTGWKEFKTTTKYGTILDTTWTNISLTDGVSIGIGRDITKRKRAEDALRESENRYRILFDAALDGICLADTETGLIIDCNQALADLVGRERAELIGHSQTILHPPSNDLTTFSPTFQKHLVSEGQTLETQVVTSTGIIKEVEIKANHLTLQGRTMLCGIFRDLTKYKQAELLEHTLYEIARSPETAKSLDDLYHVVHLIIKGLMPAENFYVALYNEKEDLLHYSYFVDEIDAWPQPEKPGKGLTAYVLRTGRTMLCDAALDEELIRHGDVEMVGSPSACWLGAPLKVSEKIIGVIALQHYSDSKAYGEREKQVLDFVSDQVANSIERKRVEEVLKESEEKLRSIVENSSDQIFMLDKDYKFLSINKTAADFSKKSPHEMIGMSIFEIFPETITARFSENIKTVFDTTKSISIEEKMIVQGRELYNSTSLNPVKDGSGRVIAVTGIVRDITERKKAENELRQEKDFANNLIETAQAIILILDSQGRIVNFNSYMEAISGYRLEDVQNKDWFSTFVPERDRDRIRTVFLKAFSGEQTRGNVNPIITKDGREVEIEWYDSILTDAQGNGKGVLCIGQDVTERKKAEEEIRYLKNYNENILESNPNPTMVVKGRQIEYVNESFISTFGGTNEEYRTNNLKDVVPSEILPVFENLLQEDGRSMELKFRGKDFISHSFVIKKAEEEEENVRMGVIFQDITERKKMENELQEKIDELERYKKVTVGRELNMIELKKEVNKLCEKLGEKPIYTMNKEPEKRMIVHD